MQNEQFIIFGTGTVAKEIYERLKSQYGDEAIIYFIDSMLSKSEFCGKDVISPEKLPEIHPNLYRYYLGSMTSKLSMKNELLKQGVDINNIIDERDFGSDSFEQNVTSIGKICIIPEIREREQLLLLEEKFHYLVPNIKDHYNKPTLLVEKNKINSFSSEIFDFEESGAELSSYDLVLVTEQELLKSPKLSNIKKIFCIDPDYFRMIDIRILLRVNQVLTKEENEIDYQKQICENYLRMTQEITNDCAYLFGAGPSCMKVDFSQIKNKSMKAVCNFFINNKELIAEVNPNVYILANEIILMKEYESSLEKVIDYVDNHSCYLVVPKVMGQAIFVRYPKIRERVISFDFNTDKINFPSIGKMSVFRKAYNVMTAFAIPFASALCNEIYIAGCDGKDLIHGNSKTAWEYADQCKSEKPYRNNRCKTEQNWQEEYFIKHYAYFDELLKYGESRGKKYISLTDSYIPCLHERFNTMNSM